MNKQTNKQANKTEIVWDAPGYFFAAAAVEEIRAEPAELDATAVLRIEAGSGAGVNPPIRRLDDECAVAAGREAWTPLKDDTAAGGTIPSPCLTSAFWPARRG